MLLLQEDFGGNRTLLITGKTGVGKSVCFVLFLLDKIEDCLNFIIGLLT